jgi:small subunit ribosomal protein S20
MANTSSAKKRVRRDVRKTETNVSRRSRIRTFIKKVEAAIEGGDKDAANAALKEAQPELMRGVTRGVYKKNTAARKISRLSRRIKAI